MLLQQIASLKLNFSLNEHAKKKKKPHGYHKPGNVV